MFCPTCGFEERQLIQYCRACGTDLRVVRVGLQDHDAITASALSSRDHISRAIAEKIRETHSADDLKKVATEVLPEIEKFLETPEEKRLRRIRTGVIFASIGLGESLIFTALSSAEPDLSFFIGAGVVFFVLGLGIILNGLVFTRPRKTLSEPLDALEQKQFEMPVHAMLRPSSIPNTNELDARSSFEILGYRTHHAFCAVGRNVVNFQRLEQILKQLAIWTPICATSSTLQRVVEKRRAKFERLTLGEAVKKWIESEYHHPTKPKQGPQPDDQIMISFGFELPTLPSYWDLLSGELESLAQERNSLIHLDLAQMNFEDEAECTALSTQLNAQNERIIRATKSLEPILTQMQELARLIASDEGLIQKLVSPTYLEEDAE